MDLGYHDLSSNVNIWHEILYVSRVSNYLPKANKFYKMHNKFLYGFKNYESNCVTLIGHVPLFKWLGFYGSSFLVLIWIIMFISKYSLHSEKDILEFEICTQM